MSTKISANLSKIALKQKIIQKIGANQVQKRCLQQNAQMFRWVYHTPQISRGFLLAEKVHHIPKKEFHPFCNHFKEAIRKSFCKSLICVDDINANILYLNQSYYHIICAQGLLLQYFCLILTKRFKNRETIPLKRISLLAESLSILYHYWLRSLN